MFFFRVCLSPVRVAILIAVSFLGQFLLPWPVRALAQPATPISHTVTWDSHSLMVDGKRLVLYSGEFQYFRLPSVSQWQDRLEKMKAAGLNAVSIYFDWQYHSWAPGQYDFSSVRDIDRLLSMADRLGIYVLARVGPYMNAEVDAGGLPGWLLRLKLYPRFQTWNGTVAAAQDSPEYLQYSKEWYDHVLPIVARHQITNGGGTVLLLQVENEYPAQQGSEAYMRDLMSYARQDGITVPIFHNDFNFDGGWSNVVDLYGFDSYPYGFDCCHQWWDLHFHGVDTWETYIRNQLKLQGPIFVPELQGGSYDAWGGVGYDKIAQTLDGDWLNLLDQSAFAQGATMLNTYMFAGGTSWGYMSDPSVYTSYDYGAAISESGELRPGFYAAHRLGSFLQAYGPSLAASDTVTSGITSSNTQVLAHSRMDAATGQTFIFLRHGDAGAAAQTTLTLPIGGKPVTVPQQPQATITLPGHGAALLVANAQVGAMHLNYTTSSVLTDASTALGHYLVVYGSAGTQGETDFALSDSSTTVAHDPGVGVTRSASELRLNYRYEDVPRTVAIQTSTGTVRVLIESDTTAGKTWVTDSHLLVGPDLVTQSDSGLSVQVSTGTQVEAFGAPADRPLVVDGHTTALPDPTMGETLLGTLAGPSAPALPAISTWRFAAEAPEVSPTFDDSSWTLANNLTTANPNVPAGTGTLADDYGFHYGFVWYRGHFNATGNEASITVAARQCYSVWLNGTFLGTANENLSPPPHAYAAPHVFPIPAGLAKPGADTIVSILTENMGHDEGWLAGPLAQSPQGLLSAQLDSNAPITWRLQGASGGEHPADTVRGSLNASGLFGEREGWYQPGFDDSGWQSVTTPDNWQTRQVTAPVGWYRTHFTLNIPGAQSQPLGINVPHASDKATIWLNGWLIGRYWEQQGPQHLFYLPDGVLNPHGDNVLAIAVWNRGHVGGLTSTPSLQAYGGLATHTVTVGASTASSAAGYWHTKGNRIVDAQGVPVRIAAVNWFGMEDEYFVPAGLEHQSLAAILARVRQLGFNAIRLPFSNQMVEMNPVVTEHLDANPDLKGLHALDVLDRVIAAAKANGLHVILDDQRSSAGTQPESNGLWYTPAYPESAWISDWKFLARRYLGDPTVIGVDLRNEPHTGPPGPWSVKAYLHQGSTWGPYSGNAYTKSDWHLAAERGGNAVLSVNAHLLIFVEGLQLFPDSTQPGGIDSYWWGGILTPARQYPVVLSTPHQLVYSPHEYGPEKWQMPFFGPHMSYQSISRIWDQHWGYLERSSFSHEAPVFLGEFGTCGTNAKCVTDSAPGSQGLWFSYLMRYLRQHPEIGWAYWALNGTNHNDLDTTQYVLGTDWKTVRLPALVNTFHQIEMGPAPAG